jgi:ubiquinone/menaquinone biosynthesis C-methylase UbiE
MTGMDAFTEFEHEGWERVAGKYEKIWSSLTMQFITPLLNAAGINRGVSVLDVACGPGYVSASAKRLGAVPSGIDFSGEMVNRAKKRNAGIKFVEGDAQNLPFAKETFDRVVINFGLLHFSNPEKAIAEAGRVLKHGGKLAFTLWATPDDSPGAKITEDAFEKHANMDVGLPKGPEYYLFAEKEQCRKVLESAGFSGKTMSFETVRVKWKVPTASFPFEATLHAGVRNAGILMRQSKEKLEAIRKDMEEGVKKFAAGDGFEVPMAAYVVSAEKS